MDKLHENRTYIKPDPNQAAIGWNSIDPSNDCAITRSVRIEVYKGNKYQGKKIFSQGRITIGKSLEADLVLSDEEIADKHACITYIDEQLVILDQTQKTGLLIRGGLYGISTIDSSEQVGIGPYILNITHNETTHEQRPEPHYSYAGEINKEKEASPAVDLPNSLESRQVEIPKQDSMVDDSYNEIEKPASDLLASFESGQVEDHDLYDLVFEGNLQEDVDVSEVKRNLVKILKTDKYRVKHFLNMKRVVLKSGLEIDTAKKYKKYFEKSGAICRLTVHSSTDRRTLPIQEEEPEKSFTSAPEQDYSENVNEVQNNSYEEKTGNDYESQIETEYISQEDEIVNDQANYSDTETSSEIQMQTQETAPFSKEEEINTSAEESKSDDDSIISQTHHSDTETPSKIQLRAQEPASLSKEEEIITSAEECRACDDSVVSQVNHSSRELSSEPQLQTQEQDVTLKEDNNIAPVKEPESVDKAEQNNPFPKAEKPVWKFYGVNVDDEEEDDEEYEDLPADFLLKDKIKDFNEVSLKQKPSNLKYLEVIKLRGKNVIDIKHLEEKEKFFISNDRGKRFCLAEVKGTNEALFSFNEGLQGNVEAEGRKAVATSKLMKDENCISKRKGTYRTRIPNKGKVLISDGYFDYQMQVVNQSLVPQAPEIKEVKKKSYRHFGVSFAFHFVFLLFLGLFPSFDNGKNVEEETRFVKVEIDELEKVMNPQPKPPAPKPPAVKPEVKKKAEPTVPTKKPVRVASNKKPGNSKKASKPSRHPDAGGGFGEGNVSTRNINETGILGMISDSVGIQPRNALAAVTNLDAVSSPNVTASNLKVGGVVGKIGTGEIAVPKGTIVSTKGSSQVLRSYGRKGEGTVAALEKGKIGEQEVMGMVTAKLDKSVRIRGGLSMDAVKRVIDAHLDDITYCYETELIANPSIVGKVMFEWKILMTGEVGEVRIKSSSINSHDIHACIKEAIRTWRFPKPRGSEVLVSYPFVFDIVGF